MGKPTPPSHIRHPVRSYSPSVTNSERVFVKCPECGERRSLTIRQARRAGQCPYCRFPIKVLVTDRYRRFWTDRYTMAEIKVLAGSVFDDLPGVRPALVASGSPDQQVQSGQPETVRRS